MTITELSVKRPTLAVVIFTIVALLGIVSYVGLGYELLPKITSPQISISTIYPGASPSEVENSVTTNIEDAVSALEGVKSITSTSQEGISIVNVELTYNADVDQALQDAQRKVNNIVGQLPDQVDQPSVDQFSFDDLPIMRLGVSSQMDANEFNDLVENDIKEKLSRIEGVARVQVIGGNEREIRVNVDRDKLKGYGLSILQVTQAISAANLDFPTGNIKDDKQQVTVRLSGKFKDVEDIKGLEITTGDGSSVRIEDIAEVYDTTKEVATISRIDGISSIGLTISKQSDGNTVQVAEDIKAEIAIIEADYTDKNLQIAVAQDSSVFTLEAADAVIFDLLLAVGLVAIIMLFFLRSWKDSIIVMVSIPVSIVATFIAMGQLGYTLNLMTLLGLSLVVGILVDDSIVVLEQIHAEMEKGKSRMEAAMESWKKIGLSVMSITLVLIAVFLPITFVTGLIADLLKQFAVVVAFATGISLVVSFTLTPLLSSRFSEVITLRKEKLLHRPLIAFENFLQGVNNFYKKALQWTLTRKRVTAFSLLGLVVASLLLLVFGFIGSEFVKNGDNGEFIVELELPKESTIEETNLAALAVEDILLQDNVVSSVFSTVGTGTGGGGNSSNLAQINAKMISPDERTITSEQFARDIKIKLTKNIPGVKFKTAAVGMVGGSTAGPIQVVLTGNDIDILMETADEVKRTIESVNSTREVELSVEGGNPEVAIEVNRDQMAALDLTMNTVGNTMQNAFAGNTQYKFRDGENEYDINIKLDQFDRQNIEDIRKVTFLNSSGQLIELQQFADIEQSTGPSRLERDNKRSSVSIGAQVVGRPVGTVSTEVQTTIEEMEMPEGVEFEMGGDLESQTEAFASLGLALLMSIVLVYLIMVALYESYAYPLVVMFSVPTAMIGAFLILALFQESLGVFTFLGLIMLVGLVIKNAILIVDAANQFKTEGMESVEAIVNAGLSRLRPILMTTLAMVIAMIPIAFASGAGAEWKNGLAMVLIGGLTSSLIFTVIIVPVMYVVIDIWKGEIKRKTAKDRAREISQLEIHTTH
ncbi:efflux RND transporter permease subunit [Christiangramia forsetii]|uniref:AcrB/AcrD/AcrF family membrane transport protein n=2 Tax=Christiangramia forsetii TaxID=411153 RepID=A0LXE5_CHRFK|nr:efflux RND transporter permease subunit [Christiangramia forsetii]GGG27417.1 multidrug ABC transporter [Christiangramia forsetii]CAL65040.1 AcrB/AcrD/AcrF family membrane transport protein [Christiangramia forsetii KT0803]